MECYTGQVSTEESEDDSTETEQCKDVRFNKDKSEYINLAVYVDLIIDRTTQLAIKAFKQQITVKYECKDLGSWTES